MKKATFLFSFFFGLFGFALSAFAFNMPSGFSPVSSNYLAQYIPEVIDPIMPMNNTPEYIKVSYLTGNGILSQDGSKYTFSVSSVDTLNPDTGAVVSTQWPSSVNVPSALAETENYIVFGSYYYQGLSELQFESEQIDGIFQNILLSLGVLVGVIILIASARFGFRFIKKAFPSSY